VAIMAAVLTTRPVHGLVTDEATAAALLAADGDVGG
jgi:DNA-binding transcriptional regulator LsrR (DeoR family)